MYCVQCGKKLRDDMLFCPYCGTPVAILDQDEPQPTTFAENLPSNDAEASASQEEAEMLVFPERELPRPEKAAKREERVISLFDDFDTDEAQEEVAFKPLNFDFDADETPSEASEPEETEPTASNLQADENDDAVDLLEEKIPLRPQTRRKSTLIQPTEATKGRANKTFIPVQDVNPDNIFMDEPEDADEYDAYDDAYSDDFGDGDDFEFEDREEGVFFRRHIRGFVGLLLMVMLLVICFIWASTVKGQTVLAQFNLAWNPKVYAELAHEAYQKDYDLQAARYYERAYSRDTDNYDYAHSAVVAYYEADKLENATAMLKICVELQPNISEPYVDFLTLYPDAETRPWEITELIRNGYQRTGDERLNLG